MKSSFLTLDGNFQLHYEIRVVNTNFLSNSLESKIYGHRKDVLVIGSHIYYPRVFKKKCSLRSKEL